MKLSILALLSVLFLAACSDSGSGGGGGAKPVSPEDFNPKVTPPNPASKQYVQDMFSSLRLAKKIHPEDAAIFSSILEDGEVKAVDQVMRDEAFRKLSSEGLDLLPRIYSKCRLNPAQKNQTGGGTSTITDRTSISSDGSNCNYIVQNSREQVTQFSPESEDKNTGWVTATATLRGASKSLRQLRDPTAQNFTRLVSTSSDEAVTGNVTFRFNNKTHEHITEAQGSGTGTLAFNFTEGESVTGPIYAWTLVKSGMNAQGESIKSVDMRMKFDGKSPKGDIVIIILATENGTLAYLNGEEVDPDSLGIMGSVQNPARQLLDMVRKDR